MHVRIIAATNKDLRKQVRQGNFRADLFFRLSSIIVTLPPLRDRKEDIELYIDKVFETERRNLSRENVRLSPEARQLLREYDYPGNVRELETILRRSIIFCDRGVILGENLEGQLLSEASRPEPPGRMALRERPVLSSNRSVDPKRLSSVEMTAIVEALASASTKAQAAKVLGISRDTLYRKIKSYAIDIPRRASSWHPRNLSISLSYYLTRS